MSTNLKDEDEESASQVGGVETLRLRKRLARQVACAPRGVAVVIDIAIELFQVNA